MVLGGQADLGSEPTRAACRVVWPRGLRPGQSGTAVLGSAMGRIPRAGPARAQRYILPAFLSLAADLPHG